MRAIHNHPPLMHCLSHVYIHTYSTSRYMLNPISRHAVSVRLNAVANSSRFRLPLISLKASTPHSDATRPGVDVMIGKVMVMERDWLATNHAHMATAQRPPEAKAGRIEAG